MSVHSITLADRLRRSVSLASRGELPQQRLARVMQGREERRRRHAHEYALAEVVRGDELARAKAALLDHYAREARVQLTAEGICWRCGMPLEARSLLAMLPGAAIVTHAECAP